MPEYTGIILENEIVFAEPQKVNKWLAKHNNHGFELHIEQVGKSKDPKTAEQLGYYWGLLLPAITEEMRGQSQTFTVTAGPYTREIPVSKEQVHEWLTELCGHVGQGGALLRLSECDLVHCRLWIDNVLAFAVDTLDMNEEALKARRPAA